MYSENEILIDWKWVQHEVKECYFYHPDHLGSSSWITDSAGRAIQHLHYLPWGEDFVDQRSTSWNAISPSPPRNATPKRATPTSAQDITPPTWASG